MVRRDFAKWLNEGLKDMQENMTQRSKRVRLQLQKGSGHVGWPVEQGDSDANVERGDEDSCRRVGTPLDMPFTHTKEHDWSDSTKWHVVAHQSSRGHAISDTRESGHARVHSSDELKIEMLCRQW